MNCKKHSEHTPYLQKKKRKEKELTKLRKKMGTMHIHQTSVKRSNNNDNFYVIRVLSQLYVFYEQLC